MNRRKVTLFIVTLLILASTVWLHRVAFTSETEPAFQRAEPKIPAYTFEQVTGESYKTSEELLDQIEELIEEHAIKKIQIMAVGDIMMHKNQILAGRTTDGYDFTSFFSYIKPLISKADLLLGNLETTFAGSKRGYGGYPSFNAPDQLAMALKEVGFDLITTANNHALDRGESGLIRTLDLLDQVGLPHTGTSRSEEERQKICVLQKNGIKVAILAYTFGTNGLTAPEGKEYLINYIDTDKIQADLQQAKDAGVDLITVAMHFGEEYANQPNRNQFLLVDYLFAHGVDIIIGSHAHVLQPYEVREWLTETGEERTGVVIYSLGNFISDQRRAPRDIGGILSVQIVKEEGEATIHQVEFIPTYTYRYYVNKQPVFHVLSLKDLLTKRSYQLLDAKVYQSLQQRYEATLRHVTLQDIDSKRRPVSGQGQIYIVKPGDTLYRVAVEHGTTMSQLQEENPGVNPKNLRVGEILEIAPAPERRESF